MCGGPPELEILCDECFGMDREGKLTDENMCKECKDSLDHLCFVCDTTQEKKEEVHEGVCKRCRDSFNHTAHQALIAPENRGTI